MKISKVMEIANLTKKAINYYEENGLISPSVKENNYRDYSEEDIEKLKQISALRSFDIPVKKIKEMLDKPEKIEDIFAEHLNKINEQIENMKRCQEILSVCINDVKKNSNIGQITNDMIMLQKSLDMSEREKEGYLKKELSRIFPGFFGKYICLKFSNYLDEPLDSKEKEKAWIHLVKVLDEGKKLEADTEVSEGIETDEINYDMIEETIKNRYEDFCSMSDKEIRDYVKNLNDLDLTQTDIELFKQFMKYVNSKEDVKYIDNLISLISEDLKILSSRYKMLDENISKVSCEMEKEYSDLSQPDANKVKNNMGIVILQEMTFIGYEYKKIIPFGKVSKLIDDFRIRVKEINNVINPDHIYTINGIASLPEYKCTSHKFNFSFIIAVQVLKVEQVIEDMHFFTIPSHKYAWYALKENKNLKTFIKDEIPMVSFITQSFRPVKFPVLALYKNGNKPVDKDSIVINYMPIE